MDNEYQQLITIREPKSPAAEAFRTLRTNIQFSSLDKPLRTLLLTSTSPEEGKSTTLANLAITFALGGSRVLMVDCDLRRPTLHSLFGLDNDRGLTSIMLDNTTAEPPVVATPVQSLWLLPSGPLPPNPSELLGSKKMDSIIETLKDKADIILLDSPPIIAVTDAAVLARKVDGILLVFSVGKTKRDHASKAKALLEKVNANILGVVLTNVQLDVSVYRYYAKGESR